MHCHIILHGSAVINNRCFESIWSRDGEGALKSMIHRKRGERWGDEFRGEEDKIWPISQFFH